MLIGVRNGLQSMSVDIMNCDRLEQMCVRVTLAKFVLFVCAIYLPPNSETSLYGQHSACIENLLELAGDCGRVLVVGDYNLPQLCWMQDDDNNSLLPVNASSEQELALVETVVGSGLCQINDMTNVNGRLLDLAFVNDSKAVEMLEPPMPLMRIDHHHNPFMLKFDFTFQCENLNIADPLDFDFSQCDFSLLNERISAIRWDECLYGNTINDAVSKFYQRVFSTIRDIVPMAQRRRVPGKRQPWWNNELRHLRNRLRKPGNAIFDSKMNSAKFSCVH